MADPVASLRIDIVSDVMCPWCIIGYGQLAKALEATGTAHEIHWHPFELNPQMPPEGQNLREHIVEKYGITPAQSEANRAQITKLGAEVGFRFNFSDDSRMHNTFNTHQLLHWANTQGKMHALKLALFAAHFTDGRDLSDAEVLAEIAGETGLDRDEARDLLEDQRFAQTVRTEQARWVRMGISSVPSIVFDSKHLVTGAQGVGTYIDILRQLADLRAYAEQP